ncbi:MAG: hypothetical protein EB078_06335 [Proteobacteria bacterium]|nr:hypothetical protein [Pseudomonadota bacterium]NDC24464.1 hypothetical protein [Pseudomonadota bacterium]NDD04504.1 hypothetical protein [Pseudomonadota bacterium]NDG26996.1 hypothetical protein [Pseudomonadota bacterium]
MVTYKKVLFPLITAALGLLFLASCGGTGSSTTGIPTAGAGPGGPTNPLPTPPINPTPGLPDLTGAVSLALQDNINYSGLADIAGNVVTPVVGDPKVKLQITNTRNQSVNGKMLVAFEDKLGFWGADMTSVAGTGANTSSGLDIIFSDNALTFRVSSIRAGDNLLSTLYYRVRQANEAQCLPVKCYILFGGQRYEVPFGSVQCPMAAPDIVSPCRTYMTPSSSNTAVKTLGTFTVKYTDAAVLPEGN